MSIVNMATANGSGLRDGIVILVQGHGLNLASEDVCAHQDIRARGSDLIGLEFKMISGGSSPPVCWCADPMMTIRKMGAVTTFHAT